MAAYSQSENRIEIIVRKDMTAPSGGLSETQPENAGGTNTGNENEGGTSADAVGISERRKQRIIKTNVTHALAVSRQIFGNAVEYKMSGLSLEYGDQSYQQTVERQWEKVHDVGGIATSASMGALYGSWGGAPGMIIGAALATISTGVNTAFKYARRERDFTFKTFKDSNSIEYQKARANISLTTGRLR